MNAEFINAGVFVDNISNVKFIIFHSVMAWTAHKKSYTAYSQLPTINSVANAPWT